MLRRSIRITEELLCREAGRDCYSWMVGATRTKDEQDQGDNPYKPFPRHAYIKRLLDYISAPTPPGTVLGTYKSRTMLGSWTHAAYALHYAATHAATRVLIQSKDEDRAINMVNMAKTLWVNTIPRLRDKWKLLKRLDLQPYDSLSLANDSIIEGVVGNPTKIKSFHHTIYISDESAIMDNLDECLAETLGARTPRILLLSSSYLGYMNDLFEECSPLPWSRFFAGDYSTSGLAVRNTDDGDDPFTMPELTPAGSDMEMKGMDLYKHPAKNVFMLRMHHSADTTLTPERLFTYRKQYPSDALWEREMEINPRAAQGTVVFPEFNVNDHIVLPREIPAELTVWMAIDPHPRTPHAMLWVGLDRYNDIYVYREYWPSIAYGTVRRVRDDEKENQFTIREYVDQIAKLEGGKVKWIFEKDTHDPRYGIFTGGELVMKRYMDQAGKAFRASAEAEQLETYAERYRRYGIACHDPYKSHQVGEDAIREALKKRPHDLKGESARLKISSNCKETIAELFNYRYRESSRNIEREQNQQAVGFRCHMVDLLRYLLTAKLYYDSKYITRIRNL